MSAGAETVARTTAKRKRPVSPEARSGARSATQSTPGPSPSSTKYTWPAPDSALRDAERFILECARSGDKVLLVPDKDADGLSAGVILYRTLRALGFRDELLSVHLMSKGSHPGSPSEREAMQKHNARWIIVLDQGSREGPALVPGAEHGWEWEESDGNTSPSTSADGAASSSPPQRVHTMVLDHHFLPNPLQGGPRGALLVNASHSEPVATTALLTWHICRPLLSRPKSHTASTHGAGPGTGAGLTEQQAGDLIDWLCLIGTMGDLGVSVKWDAPFPDMSAQIKRYTKKKLGTAIALLNAPRRTPAFDTITAWRVLLYSDSPAAIADGLTPPPSSTTTKSSPESSSTSTSSPSLIPPAPPSLQHDLARLFAAREAVAAETERCTHTPPRFSRDGRVALLRIRSGFQVHPSIATRWSGTLRGARKLEAVMCANDGYSEEGGVEEGGEEGAGAGDEVDGRRTGGLAHFSCRIAQAAKNRGEDPNLIELLHDYAARDPTFLADLKAATENADLEADALTDVGDDADGPGQHPSSTAEKDAANAQTTPSDPSPAGPARISVGNFARGHRQASGGIIPHAFFERFVQLMEIGVKDDPGGGGGGHSPSKKRKGKGSAGPVQSNTLMNYFKKAS